MDKRLKSYNDYCSLDTSNKYDVYNFIKKYHLSNYHSEKKMKEYFPLIYDDFKKKIFADNDYDFTQLLFHYFNDDYDLKIGHCKYDGKKTKFRNFIYGYNDFCSNDCQIKYITSNDCINNKRKNTFDQKKECTKNKNIKSKLISFGFNIERLCDKEYVFEFIKNNPMEFSREKNVKKYFTDLYNDFITYEFPKSFSFTQKLWHYLQNDYDLNLGKCIYCGNRCSFKAFTTGYSKICKSIECLSKYGKDNGEKWETFSEEKKNDIRLKISNTNKNRDREIIDKFIESRKRNHTQKILKEENINIVEKKEKTWVIQCDNNDCGIFDLCDKKYEINYQTLRGRKKIGSTFCTKLNNPLKINSSQEENNLYEYIKTIYNGNVIRHDRNVLSGKKELDIYIPEKNIAIEFNGLYWHSELYKDKLYHQEKSLECYNNDLCLLQIWEDDWVNKTDIVKDIIKSKMGICEKIYARKCEIKEIDHKISKDFLDKYHIQGNVNASIRIGLFYNDELVEVVTFGKLRNFMKSKSCNNGEYELYRLCSKGGYTIIGGFQKMLKYFENKYAPTKIITFADFGFSHGDIYKLSGFEFEKITVPNYSWCKQSYRYNRVNFMKHKIVTNDTQNLSESEIMYNDGYIKIYDSGNLKFIKEYKKMVNS